MSRSFAALFPGQLSEKAGMGEALASEYRYAAELIERISERSGVDVAGTFFGEGSEGPGKPASAVSLTHPALSGKPASAVSLTHPVSIHDDLPAQVGVFAVSVAALEVLRVEHGVGPAAALGYSLGTYAAYVAAGCLDVWQALDVLLEAQRCLARHAVAGGMGYVIGLGRTELDELARAVAPEGAVTVGTENALRQHVVTGEAGAVERLLDAARPAALRAEPLPLRVPMHHVLLRPVADELARFVERSVEVREPSRCALIAPMLGRRVHTAEEAALVLGRQIATEAGWWGALAAAGELGLTRFLEIGPGDVLTRLLRWTLRGARGAVAEDPASILAFVESLPPGAEVGTGGEELA